jgi:hypothetical protein
MVASTTVSEGYRRSRGVHHPVRFPVYASTRLRAPARPPVPLPFGLTEVTGARPALVEIWQANVAGRYALDPAAHLGLAGALVDRALPAHRAGERHRDEDRV